MGQVIRLGKRRGKRRSQPIVDAPHNEIVILPGASLRDLVRLFGSAAPPVDCQRKSATPAPDAR